MSASFITVPCADGRDCPQDSGQREGRQANSKGAEGACQGTKTDRQGGEKPRQRAKAKAACKKGGKKKTTETEEQAEPAGNAESSVAPAESSARAAPPSASSADQGARWFVVATGLH